MLTRLDGATGTRLVAGGFAGGCPELWAMEHPEVTADIYSSYAQAGSDIILTCTFGANPIKLKKFGLEARTEELNGFLTRLAKKSAPSAKVAGDMSPSGNMLQPGGTLTAAEFIKAYARQAKALADGGADMLIFETSMDINECRLAVFASRSVCSLPVYVTLTFNGMRTLGGTSPAAAAVALTAAGADAIGSNCGAGPEQMLPVIREMAGYTALPLIAKPNAGLPKLIDGKTTFDMSPEHFAQGIAGLAAAGASLVGGCCGTDAAHIAAIDPSLTPGKRNAPAHNMICSRKSAVEFNEALPVTELELDGDFDEYALLDEYDEDGLLCVCGSPDPALLEEAVTTFNGSAQLGFKLSDPEALEAGLRAYCGRAVVFEGDKATAAKYGALIL